MVYNLQNAEAHIIMCPKCGHKMFVIYESGCIQIFFNCKSCEQRLKYSQGRMVCETVKKNGKPYKDANLKQKSKGVECFVILEEYD